MTRSKFKNIKTWTAAQKGDEERNEKEKEEEQKEEEKEGLERRRIRKDQG